MGPQLIENMRKQAQRFGAEFKAGAVTDVDLSKRPFKISVGKEQFEAKALIIAAGASARWLGLESEQKLIGKGASSCATCDGFFHRGKEIVVVGGGDTAMEEATFLTKFASKVTIIHRRKEFRASKIMCDRAHRNEKIQFLTPYVVEEVLDVAKGAVEGARIKNLETGEGRVIRCSGFFVAIGHEPNTAVFRGKVEMDAAGYLHALNGSRSNVEGVFVAGDVHDHVYRQAVTAAGSGCMAAIDAERWLESQEH